MSLFPSRAVALSVGPISIHWYGVMYALAFVLGIWLLKRLSGKRGIALSSAQTDAFLLSTFLGVLLGGRLGFVLFYGSAAYLQHPLRILMVWEGGMSSHGGFIGVIFAVILFARRHKIPLLALTDVMVVPVAIGLALGRVGNLINGELYGTITTLPWGMYFPGVEGLRHPTQLYAVAKDLFIALICAIHLHRTRRSFRPGMTSAIFLILYGILRFIVELFREQPYGYVSMLGWQLSRGQAYTLPILALGIGLLLVVWRGGKSPEANLAASGRVAVSE